MRILESLLALSLVSATVPAVATTVVPVLWMSPACSHEKL
jgi:hypothetical protein